MEDKKYPCTGCGCCCKIINVLYAAAQTIKTDLDLSFPYKWDDTGRCENLRENNSCAVYEHRPLICRVDEMGDAFGMTRQENHELTARTCNKLISDFGLDESFKVKL